MATVYRLWKSIEQKRRRSATGQYFLPASDLRAIFTRVEIDSAVIELVCAEDERIGLAAKIYDQGLTTFAILTWMRREAAIIDFRNHDALDASLPLHEDRAVEIAPDFGRALAVEVQWQFLPYTLKHDMCDHHRIIDNNNIILPFLRQDHIMEGGFGEVYKGDEVAIIRKRLKVRPTQSKESASRAFREEVLCLKLLYRLRHPVEITSIVGVTATAELLRDPTGSYGILLIP